MFKICWKYFNTHLRLFQTFVIICCNQFQTFSRLCKISVRYFKLMHDFNIQNPFSPVKDFSVMVLETFPSSNIHLEVVLFLFKTFQDSPRPNFVRTLRYSFRLVQDGFISVRDLEFDFIICSSSLQMPSLLLSTFRHKSLLTTHVNLTLDHLFFYLPHCLSVRLFLTLYLPLYPQLNCLSAHQFVYLPRGLAR